MHVPCLEEWRHCKIVNFKPNFTLGCDALCDKAVKKVFFQPTKQPNTYFRLQWPSFLGKWVWALTREVKPHQLLEVAIERTVSGLSCGGVVNHIYLYSALYNPLYVYCCLLGQISVVMVLCFREQHEEDVFLNVAFAVSLSHKLLFNSLGMVKIFTC